MHQIIVLSTLKNSIHYSENFQTSDTIVPALPCYMPKILFLGVQLPVSHQSYEYKKYLQVAK